MCFNRVANLKTNWFFWHGRGGIPAHFLCINYTLYTMKSQVKNALLPCVFTQYSAFFCAESLYR